MTTTTERIMKADILQAVPRAKSEPNVYFAFLLMVHEEACNEPYPVKIDDPAFWVLSDKLDEVETMIEDHQEQLKGHYFRENNQTIGDYSYYMTIPGFLKLIELVDPCSLPQLNRLLELTRVYYQQAKAATAVEV